MELKFASSGQGAPPLWCRLRRFFPLDAGARVWGAGGSLLGWAAGGSVWAAGGSVLGMRGFPRPAVSKCDVFVFDVNQVVGLVCCSCFRETSYSEFLSIF